MAETILYDPVALTDAAVTVATFAEHVERCEPLCHLRYGDGEFVSLLGRRECGIKKGSNCDGHQWMEDTMGAELATILREVAALHPDNQRIYVGLHCTWHQQQIQPWIVGEGLKDKVHWTGNILLQMGLKNMDTLRLFKAIRYYPGRVVLVCNPAVQSAAEAFHAGWVAVPKRNAYASIKEVTEICLSEANDAAANDGIPPMFLVAAGMAAEPILWRLYKHNPDGLYLDIGHILDAIIDRPSRGYTRRDKGGIMKVIEEHYRPFFEGV